ncbi:hypothetical protein MLD38_024945 [Melastoma candidum]|uniref:Uncharacterized protein n=1 Tax=Melastoma candidum TaxID=119954 RepID=A0ACB9NUA3_9MYRT|nr:hypothetical protein MLD38_024945 [Melastoma candidum]
MEHDALSAMRLPDGRIKVWIHVADPVRYVQSGSMIDREARRRGTSLFLPTATYPMFPEKLAMEGMSFAEFCNAVTVTVVLNSGVRMRACQYFIVAVPCKAMESY